MNLLTKLEFLMDRDGLNKRTLSQKCGVPYTTIVSFWDKGYANIRISTIEKICDYFGVTMDYLARDEITDPLYGLPPEVVDLSDQEQQLVLAYRNATDAAREIAFETLINHRSVEKKERA